MYYVIITPFSHDSMSLHWFPLTAPHNHFSDTSHSKHLEAGKLFNHCFMALFLIACM